MLRLSNSNTSIPARTTRKNRRHRCEYPGCNKDFGTAPHLARHAVNHTGIKPWRCEYPGCTSAFFRADGLTQHARIHTHEHQQSLAVKHSLHLLQPPTTTKQQQQQPCSRSSPPISKKNLNFSTTTRDISAASSSSSSSHATLYPLLDCTTPPVDPASPLSGYNMHSSDSDAMKAAATSIGPSNNMLSSPSSSHPCLPTPLIPSSAGLGRVPLFACSPGMALNDVMRSSSASKTSISFLVD
ncbi:hypothetical protein BJ741DRAFT_608798 [Chytriomyces cf. hyalinus JEL632]|nr:hypothetical protein BJ741DRAFT_608798 [Chytriomyces cf. hyalinus JEL632]